MVQLLTIGTSGKSLRRFVELLQDAAVDAVVDVRLRNTSQLAGWSKRDDLAFALETFGIAYQHLPALAPTDDLLDAYRHDRDWPTYEIGFRDVIRGGAPSGPSSSC